MAAGQASPKVKEEGWGKELPPFPPLPSSLTPRSAGLRACGLRQVSGKENVEGHGDRLISGSTRNWGF